MLQLEYTSKKYLVMSEITLNITDNCYSDNIDQSAVNWAISQDGLDSTPGPSDSDEGRPYYRSYKMLPFSLATGLVDTALSLESENSAGGNSSDEDLDVNHTHNQQPYPTTTFLKVGHHPHSGKLASEYFFRDLPSDTLPITELKNLMRPHSKGRPWALFCTWADFEFGEVAIQSAMHSHTITQLIKGVRHSWTDPGHSRITFQDLKDFNQSMHAARQFVVQICGFLLGFIIFN
jgi:hypothetical protein